MNDQDWEAKINQIKASFNEAQSVEVMCNHIQQILNDEMKQKLFPLYNLGKNQPYWDGELQTLWDTMHNDEKTYIRCKDKKQRNYYRTQFYKSTDI